MEDSKFMLLSEADPTVVLPSEPYRGIKPFRYEDRYIFAAREWEKDQLINLVTQYRGTLVFGQSGIGKSSVINAGLVPELVAHGFQAEIIRVSPNRDGTFIVYRVSQSGDDKVNDYLPSLFGEGEKDKAEVSVSFDRFRQILFSQTYPEIKPGSIRNYEEEGKPIPVLVFDQFEELITLFEETNRKSIAENEVPYEERKGFQLKLINFFKECYYNSRLRIKFIFVFREDYLAKFSRLLRAIPDLRDHTLRIKAIDKDDIFQIIMRPFEWDESKTVYKDVLFPDGDNKYIRFLSEKLAAYFDERDAVLTEIQIVCQYLYEATPEERERLFRNEQGEIAEPIGNIIQLFYAKLLDALSETDKPLAIDILSLLVLNEHTRNVFHREAIAEELKNSYPLDSIFDVLRKLDDGTRLIKSEVRAGGIYYEINSESLIPYINAKKIEKAAIIGQANRLKEEVERARVRLIEDNLAEKVKVNRDLQKAIEDKRSANRKLRWLLIAAVGLAVFALLATIKAYNSKATITQNLNDLKSKADSIHNAYQSIRASNASISKLNGGLRYHDSLISRLYDSLSDAGDENKRLVSLLTARNKDLAANAAEINDQKQLLAQQVYTLNEQASSLQTQKAINDLQSEPFYNSLSSSNDSAFKSIASKAIDTLSRLKLGDRYNPRIIEDNGIITSSRYESLLQDLNGAAYENRQSGQTKDFLKGVLRIKDYHDSSQSELVGQIGLKLLSGKWMNIQNILIPEGNGNGDLSSGQMIELSNDRSKFAFLNGTEVIVGRFNDKAVVDYKAIPYGKLYGGIFNTLKAPKTLRFNDEGNLIILKDYSFFEYNVKTGAILSKPLKIGGDIFAAAFSPDGKILIADIRNNYGKENGTHFGTRVVNINDGSSRFFTLGKNFIKSIIYSADSRYAILMPSGNFSPYRLDLTKPILLPTPIEWSSRVAGIAPDGMHLFVTTEDKTGSQVSLVDFTMSDTIGSVHVRYMRVTQIMMSDDGKSLLVQGSPLGSNYIIANYITNSNEPIFNKHIFCRTGDCSLQYLPATPQFYAKIWSDNSLMALESGGKSLHLLKFYEHYDNFDRAGQSVILDLTAPEKVKNGLANPEKMYSYNNNIIYSTAKELLTENEGPVEMGIGYRKRGLSIAFTLYDHLLGKDSSNPAYFYEIQTVADSLFATDDKFAENAIKTYEQIVRRGEDSLKTIADPIKLSDLRNKLSTDYGLFSWYLVHGKSRRYPDAISTARRGLQLDSTNGFIYTNLALGYLFNGNYDKAKAVYEKNKNLYCNCGGLDIFKLQFKDDLDELKRNGYFPTGSDLDRRRQKLVTFLDSDATVLEW